MKNKNIIIIILILLVLTLTGYIVYDKVLKNSDTNTDSNIDNTNNKVVTIQDLTGTYYNSDYNDYYFTLKSDSTADVITSSCSDGPLPLKTVSYRFSEENDTILLEIDINNDQNYSDTYYGTKDESGNYKFKPSTLGCIEYENTYYLKNN